MSDLAHGTRSRQIIALVLGPNGSGFGLGELRDGAPGISQRIPAAQGPRVRGEVY